MSSAGKELFRSNSRSRLAPEAIDNSGEDALLGLVAIIGLGGASASRGMIDGWRGGVRTGRVIIDTLKLDVHLESTRGSARLHTEVRTDEWGRRRGANYYRRIFSGGVFEYDQHGKRNFEEGTVGFRGIMKMKRKSGNKKIKRQSDTVQHSTVFGCRHLNWKAAEATEGCECATTGLDRDWLVFGRDNEKSVPSTSKKFHVQYQVFS